MNKYLKELVKHTPNKPGIYRMINKKGETIYVGKAKNLRSRLQSYFRNSQKHGTKTNKMLENIFDLRYSPTSTELEALILETNLIKNLKPKYNILMKDDKNFAYIKIQNLTLYNSMAAGYIKEKFITAKKGSYDIYILFVEQAFKLLNATGLLGYILPHKFFNSGYGQNLRELLIKEKA